MQVGGEIINIPNQLNKPSCNQQYVIHPFWYFRRQSRTQHFSNRRQIEQKKTLKQGAEYTGTLQNAPED